MKKQIKIFSLFAVIVLLMVSCVPVNKALNGSSSRPNHSQPKTSSSNSHTKGNTSKTNTTSTTASMANLSVYDQSKQYLKKHSSILTDYCVTWIGTPHVLGGKTRQGTDCSGFVYNVYMDVYNIELPRRSQDMEKEVNILSSKNKLKEGDLVFFGKNNVNHVGIFLHEDNFIHASTSKGVIVSSLEEKYWKNNFRSCGHHPKIKN